MGMLQIFCERAGLSLRARVCGGTRPGGGGVVLFQSLSAAAGPILHSAARIPHLVHFASVQTNNQRSFLCSLNVLATVSFSSSARSS